MDLRIRPVLQSVSRALLLRSVFATALAAGSGDVLAVAGAGSCTYEQDYARVLAFGAVSEIEAHIAAQGAARLAWLKKNRQPAPERALAVQAWQADYRRQRMLEPLGCSHGEFPLDYAVANGNLEAVRWLLDHGMEPAAFSRSALKRSIFSRCGLPGRIYARPDGVSDKQVRVRQIQAYRMLIARGADVNDPDPLEPGTGCLITTMYPVLKELGAKVTPAAFQKLALAARDPGGGIVESRWRAVAALAAGESFDFRGTQFEYGLLQMLDFRKGSSDYPHVVDLVERLSVVVRMSPGIVPGKPARPADVPARFSPVRRACSFPEMGAYPDAELRMLVHTQPRSSAADKGSMVDVDVVVGKTARPQLLALLNTRGVRTHWHIRSAKGAQVLGVMVLRLEPGRGPGVDQLSFDPARPVFYGQPSDCQFLFRENWAAGEVSYALQAYHGRPDPTHTFNPFRVLGMPQPQIAHAGPFVIGAPSTAAASY
ncbi:ankyrin repeat domain-containing protein [Massilia sp. G4R7]|uniref:Ankyrin repeat domain-containing protein n=1 Tax=Massilia phyllostachyos TaxID=2898585 RepID=A0ABS8QDJ0_9BURK|nr:ankyrin repeat domain-containing protein [Massilia phyllostachyos]MCD2519076.1 ankyrin repeat domain-containing protein [Massilia phyllostachyos]